MNTKIIPVSQTILRVICAPEAPDTAQGPLTRPLDPKGNCLITTDFQDNSAVFTYGGTALFTQQECSFTPVDVTRCVFQGGKPEIVTERTVDGERSKVINAETVKIASSYACSVTFSIDPQEAVYGLGQGEDGVFNHRGTKEYLYQNNKKIPMPILLSSKNYAILFDCGCMMTYEEQENKLTVGLEAADQLDYYVIAGGCFDDLTAGLHLLMGSAPLLPRWAFGYLQSRERYRNQQELLDTAAEFKRRGIPLSCLIQDWMTWDEGKWGNKRLDKTRYPDWNKTAESLHQEGVALMVSVWPNMRQGCADNLEFAQAGKLLCNLSTYDAFDPQARALYWKQCENELFPAADGWWCDSTEPFTPDWNGEKKLPDEKRYALAGDFFHQYLDARQANLYALAHAQGIYENQRAACQTKRVLNLTRSGSPSIQQYGTVLWSGDIEASWDCMKRQIAEGLSICACGIPYWTLDIGGFFAGSTKSWRKWSNRTDGQAPWFWNGEYEDGADDPAYRELYTRWLQLGAFLPVMRSHGTDTPREPWFYGEPGTVFYDSIVKYINLRMRLLPYIYSLAARSNQDGYVLMRSLMFDFGADPKVQTICDQFMLGGAFLACPVAEPGAVSRSVYLPAGADWYEHETGALLYGGQTVQADAPLGKMPLYVRAGSLVPVSLDNDNTVSAVELYPGADGSFTLYWDNGMDYSYEQGDFCRISLHWDDKARTLSLGQQQGNYPCPPLKLLLCGAHLQELECPYVGEALTIKIPSA